MKLPSKILAIAAVASGLATAAPAAVETYTIDPVHSAVGFSIRHFVSKVPGRFTQFSGTITVDRDNLENQEHVTALAHVRDQPAALRQEPSQPEQDEHAGAHEQRPEDRGDQRGQFGDVHDTHLRLMAAP